MNNNEPNKIVNRIYKEYNKMRNAVGSKYDYNRESVLKSELAVLVQRTGAIEVMSKNCLLKLCAMQSSWRFVALHTFMIYCTQAIQD